MPINIIRGCDVNKIWPKQYYKYKKGEMKTEMQD